MCDRRGLLDASAPIIVGVDDSEQASDALALAGVLGPLLGRPLVLAHIHPYGQLGSLLEQGEYEQLVRDAAEATDQRAGELLGAGTERRMQLVDARSPAEGLTALAERERARWSSSAHHAGRSSAGSGPAARPSGS